MSEIKVSVIIPVYNTADYMRECLDSVVNQTLQEIEIICVDDGSTDECPDILKEYAAKDSRFKLLWQENQYAGAARNYGMTVATGKYMVFWDSDDFFRPKALELMYNRCERDNADLCICSVSRYFDDIKKNLPSNGFLNKKYIPKKRPFSREDIPDHILNFATAHPWNKMYKREFVERLGVTFHRTPNGDDIFFVINCIARADRITIVDKALICYRINQSRKSFNIANPNPLNPVINWMETRKSLIEHDAYPKRSFDNKIMGSLIYFLRAPKSWEAYLNIFLFIKEKALPEMELTEREEGYYYSAFHAEVLSHLLHDSPEEFIVYFLYTSNTQLSEKNGRNQELSRKLKKQTATLKDCQLNLTEQSAKIEDLETQNQKIKAELSKIKNSRSYKLARAISAIPRKIKGLFKHK